jgi:hypothetical protein
MDGEWYMTHPVLMSVTAIPFYIFFKIPGFLIFNLVVLVGLVLFVFRMSLIYTTEWVALATAFIFAFSTQIPATVINFSPDAFAALVSLAGVFLLLRDRPLMAGLFWGLAILARTPNVVPYAAAFPVLFFRPGGFRKVLLFLAGSLPCIAIFLLMNKFQWGGFLTLGYHRCMAVTGDGRVVMTNIAGHFGFEHFFAGAWGQLMDREHGLLFTNAAALLALPGLWFLLRKDRAAAVYVMLVAGSIYFFTAFFKLWYISHPGSNRYLFTSILVMGVPFAALLEKLARQLPWFRRGLRLGGS